MDRAPAPDSMTSLQRTVLWMVLLNSFTTPLMLSSVNVALPAAARELGLGAVALSWVPMAYLMASAMFVIMFGRLADLAGRKRIFLAGTVAVILTSALAALSQNAAMLLGARFLQGVSAAMLYATQVALVSSVFPGPRRGRAIGMTVSAVYAGLASGPLLGGLVIDALNWRYSFLLHVPLALAVLAVGGRIREEWRAAERQPFDARGALLYASGLLLFCLGISRLPAADGWLGLILAAAAVTAFFRHSRRSPHPLWDISLFSRSRVFSFSCGAALLMYSATYANVVLVSLFLQYLKGLPASSAGMIMMVQPLTMALLSPLTGRWSERVEPRLLASLGFSLFSSPNVHAIMSAAPPGAYGGASGIVSTTRILGQLASMMLVTLSMTVVMGNSEIEPATHGLLEKAITLSFSIAAALCVPGILLSLRRGRIHGGEAQPEARQ